MGLNIEWRSASNSIGEHDILLFALPGVGNVGKVAIEGLNSCHIEKQVARLHHTSLPPLATLDEDGLLAPPHLTLSSIESVTGKRILTLTGTSQPLEPEHQGTMAHEVLAWLESEGVESIYVLAGLMDSPSRKETFVVASNAAHRIDLEALGVDVRRDEPKSGAIGLAALVASIGPLYGIHSACAIATTVGSSGDVFASQRLLESLDAWFDLGIALPSDVQSKLTEKLAMLAPNNAPDLVGELTESPDAFYM
ncbi:MAG: PAC2 family protein [Candidatus Poseidoniaceae archaeon]|nr:PAC2 family protein [Candidatus Poseidoniaceae archaeon]